MNLVKKQLELLKDQIKELESKVGNRSHWKAVTVHNRVDEAKAIAKSAEALVAIVRRAKP